MTSRCTPVDALQQAASHAEGHVLRAEALPHHGLQDVADGHHVDAVALDDTRPLYDLEALAVGGAAKHLVQRTQSLKSM